MWSILLPYLLPNDYCANFNYYLHIKYVGNTPTYAEPLNTMSEIVLHGNKLPVKKNEAKRNKKTA